MKNREQHSGSNNVGERYGLPLMLIGLSGTCEGAVISFDINSDRGAIGSFGGRDQVILSSSATIRFENKYDNLQFNVDGFARIVDGAARVYTSSTVDPSTFATGSGTVPVGYASWGFVGQGGNAGVFRTQWSGSGTDLRFLDGFYESGGTVYHVGDTPQVPTPGTGVLLALGLLAAGANGVRRLRGSGRSIF